MKRFVIMSLHAIVLSIVYVIAGIDAVIVIGISSILSTLNSLEGGSL